MKTIRKVYGPYISDRARGMPRRIVTIKYEDGTKKVTSYARYLFEQHIGRELNEDEHVDHIDNDRLNDVISNLQVLTLAENNAKVPKPNPLVLVICARCGSSVYKRGGDVRHNAKRGCAGPFCSRHCAGKAQHGA